jgi:hypothetical protein
MTAIIQNKPREDVDHSFVADPRLKAGKWEKPTGERGFCDVLLADGRILGACLATPERYVVLHRLAYIHPGDVVQVRYYAIS